MKRSLLMLALLLAPFSVLAQHSDSDRVHEHVEIMNGHGAGAINEAMAAGQDWAKQRLEKSPRHQEWIPIKTGGRTVNSFIVFPEVSNKATAVLVIHEIFGLTDWVESVADRLAEAGYIAIAPDLLSGAGPKGGGSSEFTDRNGVMQAIMKLPSQQITSDLNAVADYATKLAACNGKLVVAGFCWGGGQSFRFATNRPGLSAAFVFYGPPPDQAAMSSIPCPVYGFYGGNDARITQTIPAASEAMKAAGKTYDPVTYEGAGHGFMRAGEDPSDTNPANKKAFQEGWSRWLALMKKV